MRARFVACGVDDLRIVDAADYRRAGIDAIDALVAVLRRDRVRFLVPRRPVGWDRIVAHQIPLSVEDGRAAHAGHTGETCDAAVALHLSQQAQDSSGVFLVEPRHQSVELSMLRRLRASRAFGASITRAYPLGLRWLMIDDNYFCRAATTSFAGFRARPEGSSDHRFPLGFRWSPTSRSGC